MDQLYFYVIFISSEPGVAPKNVTAVSNTFSSIHVSWDPVPLEQRHGIITEYEVILYGLSGLTSTENLTVEIPDLEMFVEYRMSVRAYTRKGPSPYSYPQVKRMTLETGTALPEMT